MKNFLTVLLIVANLAMLVIGIITIPPNLRDMMGETSAPTVSEPADRIETSKPIEDTQTPETATPDSPNYERPEWVDFQWYTEGVHQQGIPSDVDMINSFEAITGDWKCYIVYDPRNQHDSNAIEMLNVVISGTEESVRIVADWFLFHDFMADSTTNIEDHEDSIFDGKWEEGGFWASGPGTIRLKDFYEIDGTQYAVGTVDTPDGIPAFIALVRP